MPDTAVILARTGQTLDGMFGALSYDGKQIAVTVERPWNNNKPGISCIPAGSYPVTRFKSPHNGDCFLLHNVEDRSEIEMHAANVAEQLRGCIAPGKTFATFPEFEGAQGVTGSKLTMIRLLDILPATFTLTVINPP